MTRRDQRFGVLRPLPRGTLLSMRTRVDVEQEMLTTMAHVHRCDQAQDDVNAELARIHLDELQEEWIHIPTQRTDPEARFEQDRPFHTG